MALVSASGYGRGNKNAGTNTGINGAPVQPVKPIPIPPNPFGPQAPQQVMGKVTQKNGKWYDDQGNEAVFKNNQWLSAQQPQQQTGFNFSFGGSSGFGAGGMGTGGMTAPRGTGGVGQSKGGGYDGSGINPGGGSRPGGAGGAGGGGGFTNYSGGDPNITKATQMMQQRYAQQTAQEGQVNPFQQEAIDNLRRQQGTDQTQRATDRATSQIRDFGAGQQQAAAERKAQYGQGGGAGNAIAESAQRAQAKAAADIQMGEMGRQDQLALQGANILNQPAQMQLAQQGQNNALLGNLYGGADMQGKMNLGQQGLGLQQWEAMNDPRYDKQFQQQLQQQQLQQGQMGLYGQALGLQGQQMGLYSDYLKALQGGGYGGPYGY
jgi:hypothetical protein